MGRIIIISGPTTSGKSAFAMNLAKELDAVIINADSMQVYREIPILTAQPTEEEKSEQPHVLYGFISAAEKFSAGKWLENAEYEIKRVQQEGKIPILVGGTGLYIKTLMDGIAVIPEIAGEIRKKAMKVLEEIGHENFHRELGARDPEMGSRLKPGDTQRMIRAWEVLEQTNKSIAEWQKTPHRKVFDRSDFISFFINPPREEIYERCNLRFEQMVENGAIDEVRKLMEMELSGEHTAMQAHGVPELSAHLRGEIQLEEAIEKAQQATRNYAKRQMTWFRNQTKDFNEINSTDEKAQLDVLNQLRSIFSL